MDNSLIPIFAFNTRRLFRIILATLICLVKTSFWLEITGRTVNVCPNKVHTQESVMIFIIKKRITD